MVTWGFPILIHLNNIWVIQQPTVTEVKCAGNYAADIVPAARAKKQGFPVCLYLDAKEHRYWLVVSFICCLIIYIMFFKFQPQPSDGS